MSPPLQTAAVVTDGEAGVDVCEGEGALLLRACAAAAGGVKSSMPAEITGAPGE